MIVPAGSSIRSRRSRRCGVSITTSDLRIFQSGMICPGTTRNAPERLARSEGPIDRLRIGELYDTTYGTLWKEGPYFPRGTRVQVVGLHIDQGFAFDFRVSQTASRSKRGKIGTSSISLQKKAR